jgi:polar amino acid transport system substrate-binding protein
MTAQRARRAPALAGLAVAAVLSLAACGGGSSATSASGATASQAGDPSSDKLAQVLKRGTLVLSTDPAYPPQSMLVEGAQRSPDTKCTAKQLTAAEISGYDAETGKLVADRLGVEACFVVPSWTEIVSGNWGDRWDIAWGSGAINSDRMTRLWMTQPYRAEPSRFFVRDDSPYRAPADLNGKKVGACAGCTHELYLKRTLTLPGVTFTYLVDNPQIVTFDVEKPGLQAVVDGKIDAFLAPEAEGNGAIADGLPLRALDPPAFASMLTGFVDRSSGLDSAAFVAKVNEVVAGLHADGTLTALSEKSYGGKDYAAGAGAFDLSQIGQDMGEGSSQ